MTIIISYRQQDAQAAAPLLDAVRQKFGDRVRVGVESLALPGDDIVEGVVKAITAADAVVVIIGQAWAEGDWLRRENDLNAITVKTALDHKKNLLPVLLDNAALPDDAQLPAGLNALRGRMGISVLTAYPQEGIAQVLAALDRFVAPVYSAPPSAAYPPPQQPYPPPQFAPMPPTGQQPPFQPGYGPPPQTYGGFPPAAPTGYAPPYIPQQGYGYPPRRGGLPIDPLNGALIRWMTSWRYKWVGVGVYGALIFAVVGIIASILRFGVRLRLREFSFAPEGILTIIGVYCIFAAISRVYPQIPRWPAVIAAFIAGVGLWAQRTLPIFVNMDSVPRLLVDLGFPLIVGLLVTLVYSSAFHGAGFWRPKLGMPQVLLGMLGWFGGTFFASSLINTVSNILLMRSRSSDLTFAAVLVLTYTLLGLFYALTLFGVFKAAESNDQMKQPYTSPPPANPLAQQGWG